MKSIFTITFLIILTLSGLSQYTSSPDSSAWPTSPDSGLVIGYGVDPQIVSDRDGGAIVAYALGDFSHLKVKRVDKWGWLQWNGWNGVDPGGIGTYQELYNLTEDSSGGCFVCFKDAEVINPGTPWEEGFYFVTLNKIDHQGNLLWGNGIRVTILDSVIQGGGEVYPDGQGGCIVSWGENRTTTPGQNNNPNVFMQRFDSLGTRCWGDSGMQVTPDSTNDSKGFMLVNENGEAFQMWWDGIKMRMQKLNINGEKLWAESGLIMNKVPAQIGISNKKGGIILSGTFTSTYRYRILCQQIDSLGQKLWGSNGLTLVDSVLIDRSAATGMILDNFHNIFVSYYFAKSGYPNTYLQKLTPDGFKLFGNEGVPVSNYLSNKRGTIFPSEDKIFAFWYDINRDGYYTQKVDYSGNILWNADTLFSTDGGGPIAKDDKGGLIMVYMKLDFSINLKKISKNGILGEVIITSIKNQNTRRIPENFILYQNHPNPFNNTTIISYQLYIPEEVELSVYDITGRELLKLTEKKQQPGTHNIRLDMSKYSSGLYFYQLKTNIRSETRKLLLIK